MSRQAFKFMNETDRSHIHGELREKLLSLVKEIDSTYKQYIRIPTNKVCHICGKGDTDDLHKVQEVVHGYEHREHMSPHLCYGHFCGWRTSYANFTNNRKAQLLGLQRKHPESTQRLKNTITMRLTVFEEPVLSDEEIDLHFAQYLANQLLKAQNHAIRK
jgi:hypothetical protein